MQHAKQGEFVGLSAFWNGNKLKADINNSSKWILCCQLLARGMLWICACQTAPIKENQHLQPSSARPGTAASLVHCKTGRRPGQLLQKRKEWTNLLSKYNCSLIFKLHNYRVRGLFFKIWEAVSTDNFSFMDKQKADAAHNTEPAVHAVNNLAFRTINTASARDLL